MFRNPMPLPPHRAIPAPRALAARPSVRGAWRSRPRRPPTAPRAWFEPDRGPTAGAPSDRGQERRGWWVASPPILSEPAGSIRAAARELPPGPLAVSLDLVDGVVRRDACDAAPRVGGRAGLVQPPDRRAGVRVAGR